MNKKILVGDKLSIAQLFAAAFNSKLFANYTSNVPKARPSWLIRGKNKMWRSIKAKFDYTKGKYKPHQNTKEKARRVAQMNKGWDLS